MCGVKLLLIVYPSVQQFVEHFSLALLVRLPVLCTTAMDFASSPGGLSGIPTDSIYFQMIKSLSGFFSRIR